MSVFSTQAFAERARGQGQFRHYGNTESNFRAFHLNDDTVPASSEANADNTNSNMEDEDMKKKTANQRKREHNAKMRQLKYEAYGLRQEQFDKEAAPGQISMTIAQNRTGDHGYRTDYCNKLVAGELKNDYFAPIDGDIYPLVEAFYNTKYCSQESEIAIIDLHRYYNILRRQLTGKPEGASEKSKMKNILKSFNSGSDFKTGFMNKTRRNVLKEVAWIVTHSVLTGLFWSDKQIYSIIPRGEHLENVVAWNRYIDLQPDVPKEVKDLFIIDDCGNCVFRKANTERFATFHADGSPNDDVEFDDSSVVTSIDLDDDQQKQIDDMNEQCRQAIARDDERDKKAEKTTPAEETIKVADAVNASEKSADKTVSVPKEKKEFTFGELKRKDQESTINPAKVAEAVLNNSVVNPTTASQAPDSEPLSEEAETPARVPEEFAEIVSQVSTDIPEAVETEDDSYKVNNESFERSIPRLSRFTSIVNAEGMQVQYFNGADNTPGLIRAQIERDGHIINNIGIDNCAFYGDTLRIVTQDSVKHDVKRETFIPISQADTIRRAIVGKMSMEERTAFTARLPKQMVDMRYHYGFLDRVDMSGLHYTGSDGKEINGLPHEQWITLINNIATAVFDARLPIARFRIAEYRSPYDFVLVADANVKYPFASEIINLPSNIDAANANTRIIYKVNDLDHDDSPIKFENVVSYEKRHRRTNAEIAADRAAAMKANNEVTMKVTTVQ